MKRLIVLFVLLLLVVHFCEGCTHVTLETLTEEARITGDWTAVNERLALEERVKEREAQQNPRNPCDEESYPLYRIFGQQRIFQGCVRR